MNATQELLPFEQRQASPKGGAGGGRQPAPAAPWADAAGLSKLHNRTSNAPPFQNRSTLTWYPGASLVDIRLPCTHLPDPNKKQHPRGRIKEWSNASRARLKRLMCMMRREAMSQALVVTLTYPREAPAPEDHAIYKRHLHTFQVALIRRWSSCSGVWKLEFQSRGAAHYHLMLFGLNETPLAEVRDWVRAVWYRIAHAGDVHGGVAGTQVDPIKSPGGAAHYLVKYIGKGDQTLPGNFSGRYWGKINARLLPLAGEKVLEVPQSVAVRLKRIARKKMAKDVERSRWRQFFDRNKQAWKIGSRQFWESLKAAKRQGKQTAPWVVRMGGKVETDDGIYFLPYEFVHLKQPVSLLDQYKLPKRYKPRNNSRVSLFCDASLFLKKISHLEGVPSSSFLAFSQRHRGS